MVTVNTDLGREIAEALLDAVEMVEETHSPVGVLIFHDHAVATRSFDRGEAAIIIMPEVPSLYDVYALSGMRMSI